MLDVSSPLWKVSIYPMPVVSNCHVFIPEEVIFVCLLKVSDKFIVIIFVVIFFIDKIVVITPAFY